MPTTTELLKKLSDRTPLSEEEMFRFLNNIFDDEGSQISDTQIAAMLMATSMRLPSVDELVGAARSLRAHMTAVTLPETKNGRLLTDTCGTGGSGLQTLSTSTAAALVVAAAGQPVAKHGNRSASGRTGSADTLEALGVRLSLSPQQRVECFEETGFCFLYAPEFHQATRRVQGIRKQLGVRSIFNYIGPLANPANVQAQLLGVCDERLLEPMAEALIRLGIQRALVVRGDDGLDEITLCGRTRIIELKKDRKVSMDCHPQDLLMPILSPDTILGGSAQENAKAIQSIFNGQTGPFHDLVAANAGAALYIGGSAASLPQGVLLAKHTIAEGHAKRTLQKLIETTNRASCQPIVRK